MNVFENSGQILGFEVLGTTKCSLQRVFELANEIRGRLGLRKDLLDSYLSLIFEAANCTLTYDSANDGFEAGSWLRRLCFDVLEGKKACKDHLFYDVAAKEFEEHSYIYDDMHTVASLHYISLSEHYLKQAVLDYWHQQEQNLSKIKSLSKLNDHYNKIVHLIGEGPMEQLNQAIMERFFIVPVIPGYLQGFTNDLLFCLNHRDEKTNKRVFQLWMDHLSSR
ncbi:MAG: hypothetical protein NHB14_05145 [Desulfosporosinus sp.]|nr:hypothetical protein [Desulfosporosinus sp.]